MLAHVPAKRYQIRSIYAMGNEVAFAMRTRDRTRCIDVDIGQHDLVADGVRQQTGDQGADLAGAQNEYAMHGKIA